MHNGHAARVRIRHRLSIAPRWFYGRAGAAVAAHQGLDREQDNMNIFSQYFGRFLASRHSSNLFRRRTILDSL
ncbi:MAG: hypothetical protein KA131_11155, partial [Thauera sp.]|nr:hypothetical protein [Thauera sp.]